MIQFGQEVQEKGKRKEKKDRWIMLHDTQLCLFEPLGIEKLNAMEGLLEEDLELADRINQELDE